MKNIFVGLIFSSNLKITSGGNILVKTVIMKKIKNKKTVRVDLIVVNSR